MLARLDNNVLQSLIDGEARESTELDFKSEFNPENADHRRGPIDDVCAFANAQGGWLLLGVEEANGTATNLAGIEAGDVDRFRLRLTQMIESGLEPRLGGAFSLTLSRWPEGGT
ncbi:ATP-binding protein [Paraburkholderia sp. A3BS-1L]|uniref:AlbA family DNA-binding domain-containing protein n=1 Tax=Paraburkholderia sp. A3BS-1L TaxID=3028375 RepID=UPI003DA906D2